VSESCPGCGAHDLHHSRLSGRLERIRWRLTGRVPYRCHSCQWRGWRRGDSTRSSAEALRRIHRDLTDAELERLDPDRAPKK
jgi:hypothetical protein